jgi:uncharacterized membrane protein (DUF4010 family)
MSNPSTTTSLPGWQADRLAVLLDALDGVVISDAERRSLTWLCGFERAEAENVAAVIRRARATSALAKMAVSARWLAARPYPGRAL